MFVHLHTHSYYSFLAGLPAPAQLAQAAARAGMPALALTDRGGLSGAIEFYAACREAGVRPILGVELQVAAPLDLPATTQKAGMLVLLALDRQGWTSLCRLTSAAAAGGDLPFERLSQDQAGLICLTGGRDGLVYRWLSQRQERSAAAFLARLGELFPGRLYVELDGAQPAGADLASRLAGLAERLDLPAVACQEVYYLEPQQSELQRTLAAVRLNCRLTELPEGAAAPPRAFFAGEGELASRFAAYPRALEASREIAERCRLELPLGSPQYPQLDLPEGMTAGDRLRLDAGAGARRLYAPSGEAGLPDEVRERLERELETIISYGYAPLFLVMAEIVQFARQEGIPISSRGSAASSLVAHCLGITSPDPLRLNLYFERFLNPARATPPDIDTDLCSRRRDEVINFVSKRFGKPRVAMVSTINRFRRRSALREVAKAYGLPAAQIKNLTESLPHRGWGPPVKEGASPYAELLERYPDALHQAIFRDAAALIGLPDHLSVHPGGVVIAPGELTDLAPVQTAAKGVSITQFDLDSVARLGLVKIDLLGIKGLTVLGDVARSVPLSPQFHSAEGGMELHPFPLKGEGRVAISPQAKWQRGDRGESLAPADWLDALPEEDPETSERLRSGGTIGCFQIESPGMRATLKEIQARSIDDLMVALALYRPGPLTGGLKDAFVRRHRGEERPAQLHPALEPLLADTFGVILYQEQVLRIAHELAGLSLADADLLRRAMSHFDPGEQMRRLKERFVSGAAGRAGMPEALAERVWELMAAFAGYGFPKAHAASYAQVAWRSAWCKTHYPELFMAAVLANWGGYYPQGVYLTEARRMGLALRPPHINYAQREFSIANPDAGPALFMGLDQVRDLTRRTQEKILRARPFRSFMDFVARADPRPVEVENLVKCGALEGLGSIPALLRQVERGGWRGGQLSLFDLQAESRGEPDWTLLDKVEAQEDILGVSVIADRLELLAPQIKASGALSTLEAASRVGRRVRVAGKRQTWRRSSNPQGEAVYFMSFEDLEGMLDVVIAAEVYRRARGLLSGSKPAKPVIVEGQVERNHATGEPFIRAEAVIGL